MTVIRATMIFEIQIFVISQLKVVKIPKHNTRNKKETGCLIFVPILIYSK